MKYINKLTVYEHIVLLITQLIFLSFFKDEISIKIGIAFAIFLVFFGAFLIVVVNK